MTDFKVGDKVKYTLTAEYPDMEGWEAEVVGSDKVGFIRVKTLKNPNGYDHTVGTLGYYFPRNLELIAPTFTYEDIRKGDKIRRTKVYTNGSTEVREGVAGYKGIYYWSNFGESLILAYDPEHEALEGVTYELLERPEPPAPKLWENRKVGDKLITYANGNVERIFTKIADNRWETLVMRTNGKMQEGFERPDAKLAYHINEDSTLIES